MPHAGTESSPLTTTDPEAAPVPVDDVRVDEVRVLDGPNLYFSRPAIKVILHVPGYLGLQPTDAEALARRPGARLLGGAAPGRGGAGPRGGDALGPAGQAGDSPAAALRHACHPHGHPPG